MSDYGGDYQYQSIIPSEPNLPTNSLFGGDANEIVRPFEKVKVRAKSKIEMSKNYSPSAAAAIAAAAAAAAAAAVGRIEDLESEPFRLPRIGFTSPTKK